jgi:hypothetical protein
MAEKDIRLTEHEDAARFDRRFKYAVAAFALIEFIVIASVVYYKVAR